MRDYGSHIYDNINRAKVESILSDLTAHGSLVSGSNPWDVDTRKHGVRLRGEWNESTMTLSIMVITAEWYVPRTKVWANIDSMMRQIQDAG